MTSVALVVAKLTTLRDHLGRIERRRPADVQSLRGDLDRQDALALSVLVALPEAADIALHMASERRLGRRPIRNRRAFSVRLFGLAALVYSSPCRLTRRAGREWSLPVGFASKELP